MGERDSKVEEIMLSVHTSSMMGPARQVKVIILYLVICSNNQLLGTSRENWLYCISM